MEKDLGNYRKSYEKQELLEGNIPDHPMELFLKWFQEVETHFDEGEANAMTVSTIGLDGFPKNRIVLLKKITDEGFVFFTNYCSEKGKAIESHPNICLSFFWQQAERQVIIKGTAEKTSADVSDAYFQSRPRGSQLGALASHQSDILDNREALEMHMAKLAEQYEGSAVPRPAHWGGYLVKPVEMEFWQGRANRLHDRIRYTLNMQATWIRVRLSP